MGGDEDLKLKIVDHMGRTEEKISTLVNVMRDVKIDISEIRDEQARIKVHNDEVVSELQKHFDDKISICNEDVMTRLEKSHLDKYQVRKEITKAVKASEKRTYLKVAIIGVVFGFI